MMNAHLQMGICNNAFKRNNVGTEYAQDVSNKAIFSATFELTIILATEYIYKPCQSQKQCIELCTWPELQECMDR